MFAPGSSRPTTTLGGHGRLSVADALGSLAIGGYTSGPGTVAIAEHFRNDLGVYYADGSRLDVPGLERPSSVAIAP